MTGPRSALPTGNVTFLFTDIEGSTGLVADLGPDRYRELLERHHAALRRTFSAHGGVERGTQGDAFFVVFRDASSAVAAAIEGQRALATTDWQERVTVRVRMGLHTGEGILGGDDYIGIDIDRAARIAAAAHGGQVLLSEATWVLVERALPDDIGSIDLGRHRLRGVPGVERIFQLVIAGLPSEFPALRTASAQPGNLPPRVTALFGRERDVTDVTTLLAGSRLVTLIGPGGSGKTSLALEVARGLADGVEDGAWFVPLETIDSPEHVGSAIVAALGLRGLSDLPTSDRLRQNLAARKLLLVLDNFEHVVAAAGLVADLISAAPGVTFLVTSRAPLRIAAEQTFAVSPLAVPDVVLEDPATLGEFASVRMFVDRVRRSRPDFALTAGNAEPIAEICRRLDGIPLGIELAAARVSVLGVAGVRDRLASRLPLPGPTRRDAPIRQQTLRNAVAWSYDLLDAPPRSLFARMAVFAGGCRAEELAEVCGPADELGGDTLETVAALVEQSLVRAIDGPVGVRFDMFETIRAFAQERFDELEDREAIARRHALAYLAMAEGAAPSLPGRHQQAALDRLGPERDGFRAAIAWAISQGEVEIGLRLGTALTWFWGLRGEIEEARSTMAALLATPGAEAPTTARMRALEAAGTIDYYGGRVEHASELYLAQLDLARALGDRRGIADALFNVPFTRLPGEAMALSPMLDEAEAVYRSLGDDRGPARILWTRAAGQRLLGHIEEAIELWRTAYERSRATDDVSYMGLAASSLGATYLEIGDREAAARWFVAALGISRELHDPVGMTLSLPIAASVALDLVGPEPAATLLGAYETLTRRYGLTPPPGLAAAIAASAPVERTRASMDPSSFEAALELGRRMTPEEATDFALGLAGPLGDVSVGLP